MAIHKTIKFNIRTLKTTINLKPDFRLKENKNKKGLKLFYDIIKYKPMTF